LLDRGVVLVLKPLADAFVSRNLRGYPASGLRRSYPASASMDIHGNVVPFITAKRKVGD